MYNLKFHQKTANKVFKESIYTPINNPKLGQGPITNLIIKRLITKKSHGSAIQVQK